MDGPMEATDYHHRGHKPFATSRSRGMRILSPAGRFGRIRLPPGCRPDRPSCVACSSPDAQAALPVIPIVIVLVIVFATAHAAPSPEQLRCGVRRTKPKRARRTTRGHDFAFALRASANKSRCPSCELARLIRDRPRLLIPEAGKSAQHTDAAAPCVNCEIIPQLYFHAPNRAGFLVNAHELLLRKTAFKRLCGKHFCPFTTDVGVKIQQAFFHDK